MGKLKISPNLFLEVAELTRFREFIEDNGWKLFFRHLIKSYGIARNTANTMFKVSQKDDATITVNAGVAFDADLNAIVLEESRDVEFESVSSGLPKWVVISYTTHNNEPGTVSVTSAGTLTGTDTEFTKVLRGQPNFPVRVKFDSTANTNEYEVVEVTSDTTATLSGDFVAESGLKYQVMGTFTPGAIVSDDNKLIYEFDDCEIEIIESASEPEIDENHFIIAKLENVSGEIEITDERANYMLNTEEETSSSITESDPLVALRKIQLRQSNHLDIQFEWGYNITSHKMITTDTSTVLNIVQGESRFVGDSVEDLWDGLFDGWILLNRKNMEKVVVTNSIDNYLYLQDYNSNLITGSEDDLVIIPNCDEIEIEVGITGDNYDTDDTKMHLLFSIENLASRFHIPLEYGTSEITIQYSLKSSSSRTAFMNFSNSVYQDIDDTEKTLGDSSFSVQIDEPTTATRNYS